MNGSFRGSPFAYLLAIVLVTLACLVRWHLAPFYAGWPLFTFAVACVLSSLLGGLGAGFFALLLSLLTAKYFFIAPYMSLGWPANPTEGILGVSFFLMHSVLFFSIEFGVIQLRNKRSLDEKKGLLEVEKTALKINAAAFEVDEGILITDAMGTVIRLNQTLAQALGYDFEELNGKPSTLLLPDAHHTQWYARWLRHTPFTGQWKGETTALCKNGSTYPVRLSIKAIRNDAGLITNFVAIAHDLTQEKTAANKIWRLAYFDALTQLPNRRLMTDRLNDAIELAKATDQIGALLILDLDLFKKINDGFGHDKGDFLLQQVAQRLQQCTRPDDTVARFGGDEFVVLLPDLGRDLDAALAQAEKLLAQLSAVLRQPLQLATQTIQSSASIGLTFFHGDTENTMDLFRQADIAMYQSKRVGRNTWTVFNPQMLQAINDRAILDASLVLAIDSRQFALHYQIQVDARGHPIGAEALVRWQHPQRGLVWPAEFIPVLEENNLIEALGDWVLDAACAQLKTWQTQPNCQTLVLAVNVSAQQFHQSRFVNTVKAALSRHAVAPGLLKLELTESMMFENIQVVYESMTELKALGIQFSFDDFGTGFSALQYLKTLPFDQIKIDRSFVQDLRQGADAKLVTAIIKMARSLGIEVIAEGVETPAQRLVLLSKDCNLFQGFLFGKPEPIDVFDAQHQLKFDAEKPELAYVATGF
jgi:diguanylate cyclase (GGDEF)-like protein/PAS domain S-box-containing protein